jgi:hypothetical protein
LLVDETLARAIRLESSLAVQLWWGVSGSTVWLWRQALGVEEFNEGSAKLRTELNHQIGDRQRGRKLPPEQVQRRRQTANTLNLGRNLVKGYHGPHWTKAQLRILGTEPDDLVAAKIGRTVSAVRIMRTRLGIPTARDRRTRAARAVAGSAPDESGMQS